MDMQEALDTYGSDQQITGNNEWHLRRMMKKRGFRVIKAKEITEGTGYEIDKDVVERYPCHQCGGKHVKYLGFRKGNRYKAFTVCQDQACAWYEEF